jgi:DNA-binding CsgD family transcriptional regulator
LFCFGSGINEFRKKGRQGAAPWGAARIAIRVLGALARNGQRFPEGAIANARRKVDHARENFFVKAFILNCHNFVARTGVIVMDSALSVLASNAEAFQIFGCPEKNLVILSKKVCAAIVECRAPIGFVAEFRSQRRTYVCRTFPIEVSTNPSVIVAVIERKSNEAVVLEEIAARFGLTEREGQTVQFLMEGLTSKEIAVRMNISQHTVKSFLRFVMTKMGVSTRSGIVGRALTPPLKLEKVS